MSIHSIRNSSHRLFTSDAFISFSTGFRISNWHGCLIRARRDSLRETKTYFNLTPGELQALKQLSRDKTIILKKADNGTTSVMMSKESKINEDLALLNEKNNYHRVVTWYMGSGLKAQNMTGLRAQRKGLRAQKNGIRDHKAFEAESGIRFITRSKNLLSQYFSA